MKWPKRGRFQDDLGGWEISWFYSLSSGLLRAMRFNFSQVPPVSPGVNPRRTSKGLLPGIARLALFCAILLPVTPGQTVAPIAHLARDHNVYHLYVDGAPFLMLGGQVHNSSATNATDLKAAMDSAVAIRANTIEIPTYWEMVEPTRDKFDFQMIDDALSQARVHKLHVVLLWFATWKNAWMTYNPEWVKRDRQQFPRAVDASGKEMGTLSAFAETSRDADAHAFRELMKHLREKDQSDGTVIMVQVENECGYLGTDRDHSAAANRAYEQSPPSQLLQFLVDHKTSLSSNLASVLNRTSQNPDRRNWHDYFEELAPEVFSAWYIAGYVDAVAAAGKQAYPLPMYVNSWLMTPENERAGRWPSGGPAANVVDIWKAAAPHIDLLAPDIYNPDFAQSISPYNRDDNALFIPEIMADPHWAGNVFPALAQFNAIGFSPFGIDDWFEDGKLKTVGQAFANNYRTLAPLLPLIAKYQGTGLSHGFVQDQFSGRIIRLTKTESTVASVTFTRPYDLKSGLGAGLIIELGPDDFVIAGTGVQVTFRALEGPLRERVPLSIEDGTFEGDRWIPIRRLNGDEFEIRLPETGGIRRVRLLE